MVEVEFHNTSTHHSFSLPNPSGYSMAALSEQALVLATEKQDEQSRQVGDELFQLVESIELSCISIHVQLVP